jgi:phage terminase small subunit
LKLKNEKHEAFCWAYIEHLEPTKAYKDIYDPTNTKKQNGVRSNAFKLMKNDKVIERIGELMQERSERTEISADTILKELYYIATSDVTDAFNDKGELRQIKELPLALRRSIASVELKKDYKKQVDDNGEEVEGEIIFVPKRLKFWDKNKSLENLGRHLKLFTDKLEIDGNLHLEKLSDDELEAKIKELSPKVIEISKVETVKKKTTKKKGKK